MDFTQINEGETSAHFYSLCISTNGSMVLITESRDGAGSPGKGKQVQQVKSNAQVHPVADIKVVLSEDDSNLGDYESQVIEEDDFEEYDDFSELRDCRSIASDDSFYPADYNWEDSVQSPPPDSPEPLTLFQACCANNVAMVKLMLRQGVIDEDVTETDKNSRVSGFKSAQTHCVVQF